MKLTQIAYRNIKRNKRRSILSGAAIAIAVMTIVFMFGFIGGMMNDYKKNVQQYITGDIRIRNSAFTAQEKLNPLHLGVEDSAALEARLEHVANVKAVTRRIQFGTGIYGSPRLGLKDIRNYNSFFTFLAEEEDPVSRYLMQRASKSLKQKIAEYKDSGEIPQDVKVELLDYLAKILISFTITDYVDIPVSTLPDEAAALLNPGKPLVDKLYFNRLILDKILSTHIKSSKRMANTFMTAGFGVEFEREKTFLDLGSMVHEGRLPARGEKVMEILLTSGLARHMELSVGDKLTLFTPTATGAMNSYTFRVVGIMTSPILSYNARNFFLPLDTTQSLLRMGDEVIDVLVDVDNISKLDTTAADIRNSLSPEQKDTLEVMAWTDIGLFAFVINYVYAMYMFIAALFFLIGSTVIINTTMMVIYERTREIGTVAAMGMKGGEIVKLFFLEAFFIALISAFIGAAIGLAFIIPTSIIGINFGSMLEGLDFPMSAMIYPSANPGVTLFVFVYAVFIASMASIIPSRRAAKIEPVEALRTI